MGVRGLWNILAPVQEYRPLAELGGETVAVDLSIWVCGDISIKQHSSVAVKLYLRNLFFRTLNLLRQNTLPVMVIDGVAPNLKANTIARRLGARDTTTPGGIKPANIVQRRRFSAISNECCSLLDALGVPWVQSPGEAEAMCAFLNANKCVHACITNDGDAFLYGATNVYRHFTMDSRDASVRVYRSSRIKDELHLTQYRLALLGIFLGCDYWPAGVTGLGGAGINKLLTSMQPMTDSTLTELVKWFRANGPCTEIELRQVAPFHSMDVKVVRLWSKIGRTLLECPVNEVLEEFLSTPETRSWQLPSATKLSVWKRPDPRAVVAFCTSRLDWNPDYVLHHLLPVLALWDLRHPELVRNPTSGPCHDDALSLLPIRIIKKRTVNFVPSYEVEWKRLDFDTWTSKAGLSTRIVDPTVEQLTGLADSYQFTVPIVEFERAYPALCSSFETQLAKPKTRAKQKPTRNQTGSRGTKQAELVDLMSKLRVVNDTAENAVAPSAGPTKLSSVSFQPIALRHRVPCWDSSSDSETGSPSEIQVSLISSHPVVSSETTTSAQSILTQTDTTKPAIANAFRLADANLCSPNLFGSNGVNLQSSLLIPSPVQSGEKQVRPHVQSPTISGGDEFDKIQTPKSLRERLAKIFL